MHLMPRDGISRGDAEQACQSCGHDRHDDADRHRFHDVVLLEQFLIIAQRRGELDELLEIHHLPLCLE
ncbi:hypothetical protein SDC9_190909 [bioreactor metagenome]|uniref:Uncharacterized protein n=1 Tax=bioreactor metagenome TaxID=1076179 RepID=A0A645HWW1_9ZZZZ